MKKREYRYHSMVYPLAALGLLLTLGGVCIDGPAKVWRGLGRIVTSQDVLITDYVALAGLGAALVNAGLVLLAALALLWFSSDPFNGFTLVTVGLMTGFALFGKNIANIWPVLLGSWLYSKAQREPFSRYVNIALLATSLAPVVSFVTMDYDPPRPWMGLLAGVVIGFFIPPLAGYTFRIQNGMNLYNAGFACGLMAMMLVPALKAFGREPEPAHYWAEGYNMPLGIALTAVCAGLIVWALAAGGRGCVQSYRRLLRTSGRAPSDYIRAFGPGPVLLNMGVNGLLAMGYILLIGGELNGPTLGGIFTVMGFSAYGKHARNILPVMGGVLLGSVLNHVPLDAPALQLAGLFGTTLAPIAGVFGWPCGALAGFLHSSVVLHAGLPLEGMNLYNNGFSGGLIAIVLYPVLTALVRHRRPVLQDKDYFETFEKDAPIPEQKLDDGRTDGEG